MYAKSIACAFVAFYFNYVYCFDEIPSRIENEIGNGLTLDSFILWPNATIPFYIDGDHFDSEQIVKIMQVLSYFSFKTCLKFAPVISLTATDRVLIIENPEGLRKCTFNTRGHEMHGPFTLILGYDCLLPPNIDMMVMHALGIPFEHNRVIRDLYIDVQFENIEPDVLNLFAKQQLLPEALRELKYDPDSVTHFDQRAFSKNGHRTLIFKDKSFVQRRVSLTETDIRKIKIIYASECVNRDRLEKIDTCRSHVDFNRRKKREINRRSLRVNPDITPPPEIELNTPNMEENSEYFDLEKQLEIIAKKLHDITNKSLESMKKLLCNGTKPIIGKETPKKLEMPKNIVLPIMEVIVNNLAATIINVTSKLDVFCAHEGSYDSFLIANCSSDGTCPVHGLSQRVKRHNPATEFEIDATVNIEKMQEFRRQKRRGVQKKRMGDEIFVNNTRKSEKGRLKDYKPILRLTKNNEEFYEDRRWPQGIVPFVIDKKLIDKYDIEDLRRRIEEVNRILKKKTCVKLIEIKEGDKKFRDYLVLNTNDDYVTGHVGGRQEFGALELFKGGQHRQHTAMMVMAMLGFYFEVSRHDRDEYIRVHDRHIRPDKLHHFEKIKEEATLKVPYDFESAMHPAWQFWRSVGRKGVSSVATYKNLDPAGDVMKKLGQHEKLLSDYDIIKINAVYNCNKRP